MDSREYHLLELWFAVKDLKGDIDKHLQIGPTGEIDVRALSPTQFDGILRCAERDLRSACRALSYLYPDNPSAPLTRHKGEEAVVTGVCCADYIVIKTPRIHKSRNWRNESYLSFSPLLERELEGVGRIFEAEEIDVCIITVYPAGTLPRNTTDPDNISVKPIIDRIAMALGIDDNGLTVSVYMDAIATDDIPEGTYTAVFPRSKSGTKLAELVKLIVKINMQIM